MRHNVKDRILRSLFDFKGNFTPGLQAPVRACHGVEITPFYGGAKCSATISADFELSWAWRGWHSARETMAKAERERHNVPHLIELLEKCAIPITWATVGHLFLRKCERSSNGCAHAELPRPPAMTAPRAMARWTGDWYAHDPCTDSERHNLWYCPDLIERILGSAVKHELGSHSFSHISFLAENSTSDLVVREMRECQAAMAPFGVAPRSLVYPYNQMGHHYSGQLAELGITAVRHRDRAIRLSYPERSPSGVYKLYESMNLRRPSYYSYLEKARLFIDEAMKRNAAYHLWFHPSDPLDLFQIEFAQIVHLLSMLRDQGLVWIATMEALTAYCEARNRASLYVDRDQRDVRIKLGSTFDPQRYGQTNLTFRITSPTRPAECWVTTDHREKAVGWKMDNPSPSAPVQYAMLVDVPTDAQQVRVRFN